MFLVIFRYDFVSVRDGGTSQSPLVGRYCGHSLPPSHLSTGNQLVIRFKSDHSVSHEGFRASYRAGKEKGFLTASNFAYGPMSKVFNQIFSQLDKSYARKFSADLVFNYKNRQLGAER